MTEPLACAKRPYPSVKIARRAHRGAHYRVRVYWCAVCHAWHVTNNEKRHHADDPRERN